MSAVIVYDCPRCGAKNMTFDVKHATGAGVEYGWQRHFETFCVCRNCRTSTTFVIAQRDIHDDSGADSQIVRSPTSSNGSLNDLFNVEGFICLKDMGAMAAPEFVPDQIEHP